MNGNQPQQGMANPQLDILMAAAAILQAQNPNQPFMQNTALSLDQMFGHSGFSQTLNTVQSSGQLPTPFHQLLMNQQQYQMPNTPVQQTRSGRISRPPPTQSDMMRVVTLLSQPGMEAVRAAMETTGLLEGYQEGAGARAAGQSMQALLAGQQGQQQQGQPSQSSQQAYEAESSRKRARDTPNSNPPKPPTATYAPTNYVPPPRPSGKGSRLALTKEEVMARRKERNKASAQASRMKKQTALEMAQEALKQKEDEVEELTKKCERLERELEDMRQVIHSSGIHMPTPHSYEEQTPPPIGLLDTSTNPTFSYDQSQSLSQSLPQSLPQPSQPPLQPIPQPVPYPASFDNFNSYNPFAQDTMDFSDGFDFNAFMNMDPIEDDAADGDFQPETSPHRGSDTDGEREDEDGTPQAKRQRRAASTPRDQETPAESTRADEEDFIDPEMEDEDLFLPIEDVPVPPSEGSSSGDVTGDMMKALKVDTRDQLAAVMQKLVDSAGEGGLGVGQEVVEKLKNVIMMAQHKADQG